MLQHVKWTRSWLDNGRTQWLMIGGTIALLAAFIWLFYDGEARLYRLYYWLPVLVPAGLFLFDRLSRWDHLLAWQIQLDGVILAAALYRAWLPIPLYSGHALFLTHVIFTVRNPWGRITALMVLWQTAFLKLHVWEPDFTLVGGLVAGVVLSLAWLNPTWIREAVWGKSTEDGD